MNKKRILKVKAKVLEELIAEIGKCEKCGRTDNLTIDHIVPQQILKMFGLVDDETLERFYIQLYCFRCNQFKGFQLDTLNPRTKEILLKLLI